MSGRGAGPADNSWRSRRRQAGSLLATCVLAMFPLASASCLINDHRQYDFVDYPPTIRASVGAALLPNRVNVVRTDLLGGDDAGPPLMLDVKVFDPNVDQTLR